LLVARVWETNRPILKAMAVAVLRSPTQADDVLQEAFARVLKSGREFSCPQEAFKYLRTAVLNTAIDFYRRIRRQRDAAAVRALEAPLAYTSRYEDPLGILIREEETRQRDELIDEVRLALDRLPSQQREAIRIFFDPNRGSTIKDVCLESGVPYSTLRSRMLQGIDGIRAHLRARGLHGFKKERTR
jgi:RNA polymerase sigma-70 factor, ECF subfamily